jgi:hypothetical protein
MADSADTHDSTSDDTLDAAQGHPADDATFADVLAGNAEYAATYQLAGLQARAARGLGVVTCMDSRIDPLRMLGLQPGDAKIVRNAGARVSDDVLARWCSRRTCSASSGSWSSRTPAAG